jgi:hypothetical protein
MTESQVTICIPVAPHHRKNLDTALASVEAQTVDCTAMYMIDHDEEGPGVIRNELLRAVKTPYLIFLDADDWIHPDYVNQTMQMMKPGRYVYTDWWQDEEYVHAPEKPWCAGTWHPITTLLSTAIVRSVGGFDEDLDAMEDTDLYLKMTTKHHCGIHLKKPLFHYGKEGRRARIAHETGRVNVLRDEIRRRFVNQMGCCGDNTEIKNSVPQGVKQPGDVLAMALWGGNHPEYGRATGRRYPRMSYPKVTWVDRRDIEIRPDHWREVIEPAVTDNGKYTGLNGFAQVLRQHGQMGHQPTNPPTPPPTVPDNFSRDDVKPNIKRVTEIARKRLGK